MMRSNPPTEALRATVEVDDEGGVTIPLSLWRDLGVEIGDCVKLWREGDSLKIAPPPTHGKPE